MASSEWNPWNYRDRAHMVPEGKSVVGFAVHATDGDIGKIDETTTEVDKSHVVVDTGPWIFGRRVILPAGVVERIDWEEEKVYVDRSKDEIKASPELEGPPTDPFYDQLSVYYGNRYSGR